MRPKPLTTYAPPQVPLNVLHRDEHILVLSKPAGLLSVPGKDPAHGDCLETRARKAFPEALLVHRLDMATSGIMVMAMSPAAQANLGKQFERRKTAKTYIAKVWGAVEGESGRIDLPLRCDWPNRPLQMVCETDGKPAQTDWRVLSRDTRPTPSLRGGKADAAIQNGAGEPGLLRSARNDEGIIETTRMELTPITGRSHQLRVHMLALGHPILGDRFYAHEAARAAADRLCLHAQRLQFHHPDGGEIVTFEDPAPF